LECAQERWNVRVNSVHPGMIDTPIWTKLGARGLLPGSNEPQIDLAEMAALAVPTGVLGKALDVANGVLFLASDESAYVNGSELVIDGAMSA
jgi:NAD(P)-dependent dehydrogenase (short-subunit alcohol dehydrogenase family)